MTNPYQRYTQVANAAPASQRQLEATALLNMARDLENVVRNWDAMVDDLDPILDKNRLLWTFLATEAEVNSELPLETKANFLSLAVFVVRKTMMMVGKPTREGVTTLVNMNRTIGTGLAHEQE